MSFMHGLYTCEGHISRLQGLSSFLDTSQITPGPLLHDAGLSDALQQTHAYTSSSSSTLLPENPDLSSGPGRAAEAHGFHERYWLSPPPILLPPVLPQLAELCQGPTGSNISALDSAGNTDAVHEMHVSPGQGWE